MLATYTDCVRANVVRRHNRALRAALTFNASQCRGPNDPIETYALPRIQLRW